MKQALYSAPISPNMGNQLEEWVMGNPYPTEIKDAKTRRYVLANHCVASLFGVNAEEMVGLDLNVLAQVNQLSSDFIEQVNEVDYLVIEKQRKIVFKQVFFTNKKTILVEAITKQPILNAKQEVIGVLNYTQDLTASIELNQLFLHYEELYYQTLKRPYCEAIDAFLRHIDLRKYFRILPTYTELMFLLTRYSQFKIDPHPKRKWDNTPYLSTFHHIQKKLYILIQEKLHILDFHQLLTELQLRHEATILT